MALFSEYVSPTVPYGQNLHSHIARGPKGVPQCATHTLGYHWYKETQQKGTLVVLTLGYWIFAAEECLHHPASPFLRPSTEAFWGPGYSDLAKVGDESLVCNCCFPLKCLLKTASCVYIICIYRNILNRLNHQSISAKDCQTPLNVWTHQKLQRLVEALWRVKSIEILSSPLRTRVESFKGKSGGP